MSHDQLFKELLRAFFREFLELFFPEVAARLDLTQVAFLDRELFTDLPEGARREPDLVAETRTLEGQPELVLIHVEVQVSRDREVPFRMFQYYSLLRLRHASPVYPVVLYLSPGSGGLVEEVYQEGLFGTEILCFRYKVVGLPDLESGRYAGTGNPLASGLRALMRPGPTSRAAAKAQLLRDALLSATDEARRFLLANLIETYLVLSPAEQEEYASLLKQRDMEEVERVITTWEERVLQQGLQQGALRCAREAVLESLSARFGAVPEAVSERVHALEDMESLRGLLRRAVTVPSMEEFQAGLVSLG